MKREKGTQNQARLFPSLPLYSILRFKRKCKACTCFSYSCLLSARFCFCKKTAHHFKHSCPKWCAIMELMTGFGPVNLLITNEVLYLLSYISAYFFNARIIIAHFHSKSNRFLQKIEKIFCHRICRRAGSLSSPRPSVQHMSASLMPTNAMQGRSI